jgi:predicted glycoside hydrolase/deacetylase ChbG (UPF0249 family)
MKLFIQYLFFFLFISLNSQNLAQQLGYAPDSKLLIIHADDIGVAQGVNNASFSAFQKGAINSGSVMVPCPWFLEVAEFAKKNPKYDLGLHLTLTSEWKNYKWDGISSSNEISSLLNEKGHFYPSIEEVKINATYDDVKKELRAQVNYAKNFGFNPTHLDTHMGAVLVRQDITKAYFEIGEEFRIPVLAATIFKDLVNLDGIDESKIVWVQKVYQKSDDTPIDRENWDIFYSNVIKDIKPGLNVLLVHLGDDTPELKQMMVDHPGWGAKWRALDSEVLESSTFKKLMKQENIQLVQWNQIKKVIYPLIKF